MFIVLEVWNDVPQTIFSSLGVNVSVSDYLDFVEEMQLQCALTMSLSVRRVQLLVCYNVHVHKIKSHQFHLWDPAAVTSDKLAIS